MKKKAAKARINEIIRPMTRALGLSDWVLIFDWDSDDDYAVMAVNAKPDYKKAFIDVKPKGIEGVEFLDHCLRHELLHLVTYPVFHLRDIIDASISPFSDKKSDRNWPVAANNEIAIRGVVTTQIELFVLQLEKTMDSLGMDVDTLVDIGNGIPVSFLDKEVLWQEDLKK